VIIAKRSYYFIACIAISLFLPAIVLAACEDFEIEGTYEASWDLPVIWFLLKHSPNEPPITIEGEFVPNYAFLDTGASGILLSLETAEMMQIAIDANAQFVDTGVGGDEYFDVSEPLYIGTADYNAADPYDPNIYYLHGPWHFQVSREYADPFIGPLDVLGVPVMAGKTVVITPVKDFNFFDEEGNEVDLPISTADIKDPNDPNIPAVDFQVALRFEKYINLSNPLNLPPLPVLAYNPVIDNITVERGGISSTGNWLFDTGGMVSVISVAQGVALGLTDENGEPIVPIDFTALIGGIGGQVEIPGFIIDKLSVPTLSGFNLVFIGARVCVHDIGVLDEDTGDFLILDGVFGDNFINASLDTQTWDISSTPFDNIVIDTQNALLGFDVAPEYPLPACQFTDLDGRCGVDTGDLSVFTLNWLRTDCNSGNGFCDGADIDKNGRVDFSDYGFLANDWLKGDCQYPCGCEKRPYPVADLTHDCFVDIYDLAVFAEEWLNFCNWLNFNCRDADLARDGIVNFKDFTIFSDNW
jgi:hypothetical protein